MKKSVEKLLKNEIFKKISISVIFTIMCCFACFLNWKSVVGAEEGRNGVAPTSQTRDVERGTGYIQCTPYPFWLRENNQCLLPTANGKLDHYVCRILIKQDGNVLLSIPYNIHWDLFGPVFAEPSYDFFDFQCDALNPITIEICTTKYEGYDNQYFDQNGENAPILYDPISKEQITNSQGFSQQAVNGQYYLSYYYTVSAYATIPNLIVLPCNVNQDLLTNLTKINVDYNGQTDNDTANINEITFVEFNETNYSDTGVHYNHNSKRASYIALRNTNTPLGIQTAYSETESNTLIPKLLDCDYHILVEPTDPSSPNFSSFFYKFDLGDRSEFNFRFVPKVYGVQIGTPHYDPNINTSRLLNNPYDYLDIKYKIGSENQYVDVPVKVVNLEHNGETVSKTIYNTLCFESPQNIRFTIMGKESYNTEFLQYFVTDLADYRTSDWLEQPDKIFWKNWSDSDNPYTLNSTDDNLTSENIQYVFFRGVIDGVLQLARDGDPSLDKLSDQLGFEYSYGEHTNKFNFPKTASGEYGYLYFDDHSPFDVRLYVNAQAGYDLSRLQWNTTATESNSIWVPENPNHPTSGDIVVPLTLPGSTTLTFKGISLKKISLRFEAMDSEMNELGLFELHESGRLLSNNEKTIDGISTTVFDIKLTDACARSCTLSLENFKIDSLIVTGEVNLTASDSSWNSDERIFTLTLSARTSDDPVVVKIMGLERKKIGFKFKMQEGYRFPLMVGQSVEGDWIEPTDQPTANLGIIDYDGDFTFMVKTEDYASWTRTFSGNDDNPSPDHFVFNRLLYFNGGTVSNITSSGVEDQNGNLYKITFKNVKVPHSNTNDDIVVTFEKDTSETHDINICFTGINLPSYDSNNNPITVSQGDQNFEYVEDRGNTPYVWRATIKGEDLTHARLNSKTKITLDETDNFYFDYSINHICEYTDSSGNYFNFNINTDNVSESQLSFELQDTWSALKSQNLEINCRCLLPRDKKVVLENVGFNTTVTDEHGSIFQINENNGVQMCDVPYGSTIKVTITAKKNYSMEDPENQFKAFQIQISDGEISYDPETDDITSSWNIQQIGEKKFAFDYKEILMKNIKVEFISDQNNIPITFKNVEGIDYYYAHMRTGNPNTLDMTDPFDRDAENSNKKLLQGIVTVPIENDYYFAVGVQAGYDVGNLVITSNGKTLHEYSHVDLTDEKKEGCKFYKLENIESSITIAGSVSKKIMTVAFETSNVPDDSELKYMSDNSNVTGQTVNATYGNSVTFTVSVGDKYSQSDFKVYVKNADNDSSSSTQDQELTKYQGEYKILDITENKKVYVTGLTVNNYVINFVPSDRAEYLFEGNSFQGTKDAEHGSTLEFKVRAKTGYKLDGDTIVNYQSATDSRKLNKTANSGSNENVVYTYKLSAIHENCNITIENVDDIMYKVTLQDVPGVTYLNDKSSVISGGMKVKYGSNFEFSVNVDDSYDDSAAGMFIVLNDGKSQLNAQKLSSGRYMISNITENVKIRVGNIRKNTYTVTLRNEEGIDYYNSDNKIITGDNTVDHGNSFSFKVSLYPAYSDSEISVMLGNDKMSADSSGYYTIPGVVEDKMVTVTGIHPNSEVELINSINNLPNPVKDLNDVNPVIEASRLYNSLTDAQKANVTNADVLMELQRQAGELLHNIDGISIDGADWYIKLVVVPISSDMDACARIYKKLSSEYILSLYDIYLWDTLNDVKYTSYGDKTYTVTIPAPKLTNFRNPTGVHENSDSGKVTFMDLTFSGDRVSFETNSFSVMGIVASHDPSGGSSLFSALGANLPWIRDYVFRGARSSSGRGSSVNTLVNDESDYGGDSVEDTGNISDKFRSANNRVTPQGSALRLVLVLLVLILLALAIWFIYKKRKESEDNTVSEK